MISLDVGVAEDGWVADAATTVSIGPVQPEARKLLDATQGALFAGADRARPGNHLGDVSSAIQEHVESEGFSIIRSLVGHGIGRDMPRTRRYRTTASRAAAQLEPGMVLAIEPMVNAGEPDVRVGDDNWADYSADGSLAAHFEFAVALTENGPRILTPWHEE